MRTLVRSGSGLSSSSNVVVRVGEGSGVAASFANSSSWCFLCLRRAAGGDGGGLGGRNCLCWWSCDMVWCTMMELGPTITEIGTTETTEITGVNAGQLTSRPCRPAHLPVKRAVELGALSSWLCSSGPSE